MKKDYRLEIASLIGEIQTLGYMVNEFTEYCVFIRYYGHTNGIDIEVAASKQNYSNKCTDDKLRLNRSKYWKSESEDEALFKKLRAIKAGLKMILRKHEIDYSRLNYTIEEVRHYKLS